MYMTIVDRRRPNLSQLVVDQLLDRIRSGDIRPGERFRTQRMLMQEFDVGANVAREALQSLVMMGVIDVRPGRGGIVKSVSIDAALGPEAINELLFGQSMGDLIEFRTVLEVAIVERAAERASRSELDVIEGALHRFEEDLNQGRTAFQTDVMFHRSLASASHNIVYTRVLDSLVQPLTEARMATEAIPGTAERARAEHRSIFEAISQHDAERAREAMAEHLRSVQTSVDSHIVAAGQKGDPVAAE
jgi:GntR family transcriptional repressor for pyruvate dehydrogenase complex